MYRWIVCCFLLANSLYTEAFSYRLEITEQELQQKVSAMMPMEKQRIFMTLRLSEPKIDLLKVADAIALRTKVEVKAPGNISAVGSVHIKGFLKYNAVEGAFYLHEPTIIDLTMDNLSEKMTSKVFDIAQLLLSNTLASRPIYRLKDDSLKHKLAKSLLKSIEIKNEILIVTLDVL